jgi:hypothetical protein
MFVHLILELLHVARRYLAIAGNVSEVRLKASIGLFEIWWLAWTLNFFSTSNSYPWLWIPLFLLVERPYIAASSGPIAAMVVFLVFWQVARNPPKEIKFQQSHAHTCAQGIIVQQY